VGLNVAVALTSALVVLPPLLVWAERRHWVTKGLVPDDVLAKADLSADHVPIDSTGPAVPA